MNKERINKTWAYLKTKNTHHSKALLKYAKNNNINEMTFRRDLHLLEKNNLVKLNYGYLEVISPDVDVFEHVKERVPQNIDYKEEIAKLAVVYVDENDTIFVGPGTTCEIFTSKINKKVKAFVSNGINVLNKASKNQYINNLIMLGGKLIDNTSIICGSTAMEQLEKFTFQKAFITVQHVDSDGNVYLDNHDEFDFFNKVLKVSDQKYLLVDSSKFNKKGLLKVGHLSFFDQVIKNSEE